MKTLPTLILSTLLILGFNTKSQTAAELVAKGQSEMSAGHNLKALDHYNQAIELDPEYLDSYLKRAFVYSMMDKHELAIKDYDRIIEKNPLNSYMYVSRGSAYNKLKQFDKAIQNFDKAIELDKSNTQAYNNRGWAKKGKGDKDGACEDWKKSKKMGNDEAKIILRNNQC